jgi:hypothetical protein
MNVAKMQTWKAPSAISLSFPEYPSYFLRPDRSELPLILSYEGPRKSMSLCSVHRPPPLFCPCLLHDSVTHHYECSQCLCPPHKTIGNFTLLQEHMKGPMWQYSTDLNCEDWNQSDWMQLLDTYDSWCPLQSQLIHLWYKLITIPTAKDCGEEKLW